MKQKMARYEMHKYWGKKPSKQLFDLIQRYSKVGDVVLDPFAGYGVFLCEAYLNGRNAIGSDLNPAATFIQEQLLNSEVDIDLFEAEMKNILEKMKSYEAEWYIEKCPLCGADAKILSTLRSKKGIPQKNKIKCSCKKTAIECEMSEYSSKSLIKNEEKIKVEKHPISKLIRNGRISALDNMTTDDLFTIRALICHIALFKEIELIDNINVKNLAKFTFTSNLANCSKLVPPIKSRGEMEPGAWMTGFYIGESFIENNVFHYFNNRVIKVISGKTDFFNENKNHSAANKKGRVSDLTAFDLLSTGYVIDNQDAKKLKYPDNSVDYIFTDPPYGDTVPYFEQSAIWNTWLDNSVDYNNEVVISDSKLRTKSAENYGIDIAQCIKEIWRVLKPNKYFSITFHSLSGEEWYALMHACLECGFTLCDIELLTQKTFAPRQLNRKVTVKGDLLITLIKPAIKPKLKFISENETKLMVVSEVEKMLKTGKKTTNEIYVQVLKVLFSEHVVFAKTNFIEILTDKFLLDENGFWDFRTHSNSTKLVNKMEE